jgi:hypothetical protein
MGRLAAICILLTVAATGTMARNAPILEPAEVVDMHQTLINSGGTLEVKESHGNVNIIGWEQPQIEVTVTKSTNRRFSREDIDQAIAELDRIVVTTDHVADNHVVIRTQLPSPNGYIRTSRGRSKVKLQYTIKVPKQTKIIVTQDEGQVSVRNVSANVELNTCRGGITLRSARLRPFNG